MCAMTELAKLLEQRLNDGTTNVSMLAREVGCSRQSIYNVLSGGRNLSLPMAEKLAECLGAKLAIQEKLTL